MIWRYLTGVVHLFTSPCAFAGEVPFKSIMRFCIFCLAAIGMPGSVFTQNRKADSLEKIVFAARQDTSQVNAYNALGWELCNGDPDSSIALGSLALDLAEKIGWEKGRALSFHNLGWFNYLKGNFTLSHELYTKALSIREKLKDKSGLAKTLGNMGLVYWQLGEHPKALDHYFKALKIAEELKNKSSIARHLGNIGIVYYAQADYPKALDYYSRALTISEELGNKTQVAAWLGNIGSVYYTQADYPKALEHYIKAMKLAEELGDKNTVAANLGNMGNVYNLQGEYPNALDHYFKALKLGKELGDRNRVVIQLGNIGALFVKTKKFDEAEKYLKHAIALCDSIGALEHKKGFEKTFSELEAARGNYSSALDHYKKYISARDSITNEENTKKTVQAQMQYDFDKQQAADSIRNAERLKQEELKHEQEIQQQRVYTFGGVIGFLLMLVVAGVSYNAFRQKQKANAIISEQKNLVELKQKEILDSIHYARRIQNSLLPTEAYLGNVLNRLKNKKFIE